MQKKPLFRKGLALAIVVLFVGIGIIPIAESLSVEKHSPVIGSVKEINNLLKSESRGINVTLHGKMGNNGWYVGPVTFGVTADNGTEVIRIQYNLDGGAWKDYTASFEITTDGYHHLEVKVLDQYGNEWYFSFDFKIDRTEPMIVVNHQRIENKIVITALPYDNMSGVAYVEFYLNQVLKCVANAPGPYIWTLTPIPDYNCTVKAVVYDNAGNSAYCIIPISCSLSQSYNQQDIQQNPLFNLFTRNQQSHQFFRNLLYNLLLRHQMIS
jgi:hypothetical protein